MKNKVKPNKNALLRGYINCTQNLKKINEERGITLIALIVTVIILVIISAVAINIAFDEDGILTSTETATKNYSIAEYKEIVEQKVQETILEKAVMGEEANIGDLQNNLNNTEMGFQTITKGDSISDVIVRTKEGYLFEAYFDESFGEYHVEYMGEADSSAIPEVEIEYNEVAKELRINATIGNVNKISISLNGEEVNSQNGNSLTYIVTDSGRYVIKIETEEGITRYGYVNIGLKKDILTAPKIEVTAGVEGNSGWYKSEVNVNIDPSGTNGQKMKYKLVGATEQEETEIVDMTVGTTITIENAGLTKVIAWVEYEEEGKTYKSDYSYYSVKIDNVEPETPVATITATEGNETSNVGTYWYKTTVEVEITAEDANSGVYGYTYSITGTTNVSETNLIGNKQKITFETDGTFTMIIKAVDRAGNISNAYSLTVYKDSTEPNEFMPNISNITNNSFTISAYTTDDTSGIAKYEYYVNNDKKYEGTENTYTVSGLSRNQTYGIYVLAYDKAGNIRSSQSTSVYTSESMQGEAGGGSSGGIEDGATIGYGQYTITYDANGVEVDGLPSPRYFIHGETVTLSYDFPHSKVPGYNFLAWSTDPEANETLYYPGGTITGYGNITLYAIWTDKSTITFNANGGDYIPATLTFNNGDSIVLPSNAGKNINNEKAELLGWAYTADNDYVYYKPGEAYNDYAHGSCTLYAVWNLGNVVYIDTNGGYYEKTYEDIVPQILTFANGSGVYLPTDAGNLGGMCKGWSFDVATEKDLMEPGFYFSDASANGKTLYAIWKIKLGEYVAYKPNSASFTFSATYNGKQNQTYSTETISDWRILKIDNNSLELIAYTRPNSGIILSGVNGYNNGVLLLNDACKTMYSNNEIGAIARNVKIEDIEAVSNFDKSEYKDPDNWFKYGEEHNQNSSEKTYYPNIFSQEKIAEVNGKKGTSLGISEQKNYVTGSSRGSILKAKTNHYEYQFSNSYMKSIYVELFGNGLYWVASRCLGWTNMAYDFRYGINYVDGKGLKGCILYRSNNETLVDGKAALCPIVEIDLSKVNVGETGLGTIEEPYSIEAK